MFSSFSYKTNPTVFRSPSNLRATTCSDAGQLGGLDPCDVPFEPQSRFFFKDTTKAAEGAAVAVKSSSEEMSRTFRAMCDTIVEEFRSFRQEWSPTKKFKSLFSSAKQAILDNPHHAEIISVVVFGLLWKLGVLAKTRNMLQRFVRFVVPQSFFGASLADDAVEVGYEPQAASYSVPVVALAGAACLATGEHSLKTYMRYLAFLPKYAQGLGTLADAFDSLVSRLPSIVQEVYYDVFPGRVTETLDTGFLASLETAIQYHNLHSKDPSVMDRDPDFARQVCSLYDSIVRGWARNQLDMCSSVQRSRINQAVKDYKGLHAIAIAKAGEQAFRPCPVGIHFWGDPGVGKTVLSQRIATVLFSKTVGAYYTKPNRNEYWDGYYDQPCVILDEFFAVRRRDNAPVTDMLNIISNAQFRVNMAAMDAGPSGKAKGATFTSPLVITTGNESLASVKLDMPAPNAYYRRFFDIKVSCVFRGSPDEIKQQIRDMDPEERAMMNHLRFNIGRIREVVGDRGNRPRDEVVANVPLDQRRPLDLGPPPPPPGPPPPEAFVRNIRNRLNRRRGQGVVQNQDQRRAHRIAGRDELTFPELLYFIQENLDIEAAASKTMLISDAQNTALRSRLADALGFDGAGQAIANFDHDDVPFEAQALEDEDDDELDPERHGLGRCSEEEREILNGPTSYGIGHFGPSPIAPREQPVVTEPTRDGELVELATEALSRDSATFATALAELAAAPAFRAKHSKATLARLAERARAAYAANSAMVNAAVRQYIAGGYEEYRRHLNETLYANRDRAQSLAVTVISILKADSTRDAAYPLYADTLLGYQEELVKPFSWGRLFLAMLDPRCREMTVPRRAYRSLGACFSSRTFIRVTKRYILLNPATIVAGSMQVVIQSMKRFKNWLSTKFSRALVTVKGHVGHILRWIGNNAHKIAVFILTCMGIVSVLKIEISFPLIRAVLDFLKSRFGALITKIASAGSAVAAHLPGPVSRLLSKADSGDAAAVAEQVFEAQSGEVFSGASYAARPVNILFSTPYVPQDSGPTGEVDIAASLTHIRRCVFSCSLGGTNVKSVHIGFGRFVVPRHLAIERNGKMRSGETVLRFWRSDYERVLLFRQVQVQDCFTSAGTADMLIITLPGGCDHLPSAGKYMLSEDEQFPERTNGVLMCESGTKNVGLVERGEPIQTFKYREGFDFVTKDNYKYYALTKKGDCGMPLIALTGPKAGRILGFHVYGRQLLRYTGYAAMLTRQAMFEPQAMELLGMTDQGGANQNKTTLRPSCAHGMSAYDEENSQPAILSDQDGRKFSDVPILETAAMRYAKETLPLPAAARRFAKTILREMKDEYAPTDFPPYRVLTVDEAINGVPEMCLKPINVKTSAGVIPGKAKSNGKHFMFVNGDRKQGLKSEYLEELMEIKRRLEAGEDSRQLWKLVLKDELRPQSKIEKEKTRPIAIPTAYWTILYRMVFGWDLGRVYATAARGFWAPGMNVFSPQWTEVILTLETISDEGFDGDFSGFDSLHNKTAMTDVKEVWDDCAFGSSGVRRPDWATQIFQELIYTKTIVGNKLYKVTGCLPSGAPSTTPANTDTHIYVLLCAYYELVPPKFRTYSALRRNFWMFAYGDDGIYAVGKKIRLYFNGQSVSNFFARFKIKMTPGNKEGVFQMKPIRQNTFLKCVSSVFPAGVHCGLKIVPLMSLNTLYRMVAWVRGRDVEERTLVNFHAALRMVAFHGEEVFNEFVDRFRACWTGSAIPKVPSYDVVVCDLVGQDGIVQDFDEDDVPFEPQMEEAQDTQAEIDSAPEPLAEPVVQAVAPEAIGEIKTMVDPMKRFSPIGFFTTLTRPIPMASFAFGIPQGIRPGQAWYAGPFRTYSGSIIFRVLDLGRPTYLTAVRAGPTLLGAQAQFYANATEGDNRAPYEFSTPAAGFVDAKFPHLTQFTRLLLPKTQQDVYRPDNSALWAVVSSVTGDPLSCQVHTSVGDDFNMGQLCGVPLVTLKPVNQFGDSYRDPTAIDIPTTVVVSRNERAFPFNMSYEFVVPSGFPYVVSGDLGPGGYPLITDVSVETAGLSPEDLVRLGLIPRPDTPYQIVPGVGNVEASYVTVAIPGTVEFTSSRGGSAPPFPPSQPVFVNRNPTSTAGAFVSSSATVTMAATNGYEATGIKETVFRLADSINVVPTAVVEPFDFTGVAPSPPLEVGGNPVESVFFMTTAEGAREFLERVVPFEPQSGNVADVLKRTVDVARAAFGRDKPNRSEEAQPLVRRPLPTFANGVDNVTHIPTMSLSGSISMEPDGLNPLSAVTLPGMLQRPTWVTTVDWTTSHPSGSLLWSSPIDPVLNFSQASLGATYEVPLLTYASLPAALWTGDIEFVFEFVKSRMHAGKAVVVTQYANWDLAPEMVEAMGQYVHEIDLARSKVLRVRVPYSAITKYLSVARGSGQDPSTHSIGLISLRTLTVLPPAEPIAEVVPVNIYVAACENFRLFEPGFQNLTCSPTTDLTGVVVSQVLEEIVPFEPQSGELGVETDNADKAPQVNPSGVDLSGTRPMNSAFESWSLAQFAARKQLIAKGTWSEGTPTNTVLVQLELPSAALISRVLGMPIERLNLMRASFDIEVTINSTPFSSGRMILYFLPLTSPVEAARWQNQSRASQTATQHVMLDPADSETGTLRIPFVHMQEMLQTKGVREGDVSLGTVFLSVFNPLRIGGDEQKPAAFVVYASMPDFSGSVPQPGP